MTTTTTHAPGGEMAVYRAVVWTEALVFCLLVWRAVILLALSLVR